ncbi:hypothetical protein HDE_07814 [Halotydeus destructor]|nr:hypothetical protein HDE_07814 [Halotydeus destructor]
MPDAAKPYLEGHVAEAGPVSQLDDQACGKFRKDPRDGDRIFHGRRPYPGQFPWAVCMLRHSLGTWVAVCTGAIFNRHFILIAAHCFLFDDHEPFYVTYGTSDCLNLPTDGTFRRVVKANTTVLQHPEFKRAFMFMYYDVALIRLLEPIDGLPAADQDYTGGLVNSLCLHTNQHYTDRFDVNSPQKVYLPGFGFKGPEIVGNHELTWSAGYRQFLYADPQYFTLYPTALKNDRATDLLEYYGMESWHTACPGDSGSSYLWYVNTRDPQVANVSKYRAMGVAMVNSGFGSCEFHDYHEVTRLGVTYDMAIKLYHPEIYGWLAEAMAEALQHVPEPPQPSPESNFWPNPPFHV